MLLARSSALRLPFGHHIQPHHVTGMLCSLQAQSLLSYLFPADGFPTNKTLQSMDIKGKRESIHYKATQNEDKKDSQMTPKWSSTQAAKFVHSHEGKIEETGKVLKPFICHWSGHDVGEFMTMLYLDSSPRAGKYGRIREPIWRGLDIDGATALGTLLDISLPDKALEPAAITTAAHIFLETYQGTRRICLDSHIVALIFWKKGMAV